MDIIDEADLTDEDMQTLVDMYGFSMGQKLKPWELHNYSDDEIIADKEDRYRENYRQLHEFPAGECFNSMDHDEYRLRYGSSPRF